MVGTADVGHGGDRRAARSGAACGAYSELGREVEGLLLDYVFAGIWEVDVGGLGGRATIANVGGHHSRKFAELVLTTGNGDLGAIHVHLSVADVIEPSPCKNCVSVRHFIRNRKIDVVDAIRVGGRAHNRTLEVVGVVGWTTTDKALKDIPIAGFLEVGSGSLICHADLAGTTSVDGSICASTKAKFERNNLAGLEVGDSALSDIGAVAGEIVAGGIKRILRVRAWNRRRVGDEEMGVCRSEEEDGRESLELHVRLKEWIRSCCL